MINTVEKEYDKFGFCGYKITYTDNEEVFHVPHDTDNRHYQEILEWVENGGVIVDNGA